MTQYLEAEDLLALAKDLRVGPVRDAGLLDAAAHRPRAVVLGTEAYPGLALKLAVLLDSIVGNHPLVDGNKRLGWLACVVFANLNGNSLEAPDDDAFDLVMAVAARRVEVSDVVPRMTDWLHPAS